MANITYSSGVPFEGGGLRRLLQRSLTAVRQQVADLQWELAEQRRQIHVERALRDLDVSMMRDIGVNRNAC